jgi:hypothetical protein
MRVVVHYRHAAVLPQPLEASAHAAEGGERLGGPAQVATDGVCGGEGGDGVPQIVHTRYPEAQRQRPPAPPADRGLGPVGMLGHVGDPHVRLGGETEAAKPAGQALRDAAGARIVRAHDRGLRPPGELDERVLQRRHGAVALQVVGLDVVHDRDSRMQREKGLVVLVGLDDEEVVAGDQGVAAPGTHPPAGDAGRRQAGGGQSLGRHHGRRGLAMRARHRHRAGAPDQRRQRFLAGHDWQPQGSRPLQLRMSRGDRRGDDHRARAFQMGGIMALPDARAHGREVGRAARIGIAPAHDDSPPAGDQRERTHAGPADTYEMDGATIRGSKQVHWGLSKCK